MKELVEILAKALVDRPDEVDVRVVERDKSMVVQLHVAPDDMGKVIGKQGRVAKAIRTLVKAAATRQRKKVTVDIV
ncbi:MAG: KH domain-containing protein [Peptococcaceae bacterium]|nr:KH domain-containing protein [Peptococcaceae bacterium]